MGLNNLPFRIYGKEQAISVKEGPDMIGGVLLCVGEAFGFPHIAIAFFRIFEIEVVQRGKGSPFIGNRKVDKKEAILKEAGIL